MASRPDADDICGTLTSSLLQDQMRRPTQHTSLYTAQCTVNTPIYFVQL